MQLKIWLSIELTPPKKDWKGVRVKEILNNLFIGTPKNLKSGWKSITKNSTSGWKRIPKDSFSRWEVITKGLKKEWKGTPKKLRSIWKDVRKKPSSSKEEKTNTFVAKWKEGWLN